MIRRLFFDFYGVRLWVIMTGAVLMLSVNRHGCEREAVALGVDWRYGWAEGCLVSMGEGRWIDIDKYRAPVPTP